MRNIREYRGKFPQLHHSVFVAPSATVIGNVEIGAGASVWYGAVVRGDVMPIRIGARTNIQDLSVLHGTTGEYGVEVGEDVTVGHRAILHGCTVGDGCLIGMGAIVLDGCVIGEGSLIAAGALLPPGTEVPPGSMVAGLPGKVVRELSDEEREQIRKGAGHYTELAEAYGDPTT